MTELFAHRGASFDCPENSLEAFEEAKNQQADGVELDVRRTRDRVLVVCHDPFTPSGIEIADTSYLQICHEVVTLEQALAACAPLVVNVEIKNSPTEPGFDDSATFASAVVAEIANATMTERVIISSFDLDTINRVRAIPEAPATGFLVIDPCTPHDAIEQAVASGHSALHPFVLCVTQEWVARAHDAGLATNVWTVDDLEKIAELQSWGVDTIITNRPALARTALV